MQEIKDMLGLKLRFSFDINNYHKNSNLCEPNMKYHSRGYNNSNFQIRKLN